MSSLLNDFIDSVYGDLEDMLQQESGNIKNEGGERRTPIIFSPSWIENNFFVLLKKKKKVALIFFFFKLGWTFTRVIKFDVRHVMASPDNLLRYGASQR